MNHTIDFIAPDPFPSLGTHTETLVLDRVIHWTVIDDRHRKEMYFREELGEITCIALESGGPSGRVWVYSVEKAEDFTRRYNEAMCEHNWQDGWACEGEWGRLCQECGTWERQNYGRDWDAIRAGDAQPEEEQK